MAYELKPENVELLVVHCSDSPPDRGDTAADINRWHLNRKPPFDLIGYHKVILPNGDVQNGRPEYVQGAHVITKNLSGTRYNAISLSVCLIGEDYFTQAQYDMLARILKRWQSKYPGARIVGHSELDGHKTCPNFDVRAFVNNAEGLT